MRRITAIGVVLTCALLLAGSVARSDNKLDQTSVASAEQVGKAFTAVARRAIPAVVFIRVERQIEGGIHAPTLRYNDPFDLFNDDFFDRFFRHRVPQQPKSRQFLQRGQGSGFIIDSDGLILTNHHVVGGADRIRVHLHDGRELDAELVGSDKKSDVALLRVDAEGLPRLELGDSEKIEVGEWVVAVGNPFGLTETVTSGIVSAKGRTRVGITDYEDFIQTDAAINPGNSGGPLLDLRGRVIGINSAILSRSGGYMGIGFAIPANLVKSIQKQLLEAGKVERGFLGVLVQDVTGELAKSFGLEEAGGALISDVTEDSPAGEAGLQSGDVVLALNGTPVRDSAALRNSVAGLRPGARVELKIVRDSEARTIVVTLGRQDEEESSTPLQDASEFGIEVGPLTNDLAARLDYEGSRGVVVKRVTPGSVAAMAGIRPGNLILAVNRTPVATVDEFRTQLAKSKERALLRIRDGRHSRFVVLRVR